MKNNKSFFGCMNFNRTVFEEHKEPLWEPQWKKPATRNKSAFDDEFFSNDVPDYFSDPWYSYMPCNIFYTD